MATSLPEMIADALASSGHSLLRPLCPLDIGLIGAVATHIVDVLVGDAAVALPSPRHIPAHVEAWRPCRTVASWYLYRAVDLEKAARIKTKEDMISTHVLTYRLDGAQTAYR